MQPFPSITQPHKLAPMRYKSFDHMNCSLAQTLNVIGERWTLLILRDAFLGVRRFDEFQRSLGIARNVLNTRLQRLVDDGLLEKRLYQERPERFEYRLTEKGKDLWPTLVTLMHWGDKHAADEDGPPVALTHQGCGGAVDDRRICAKCGAHVGLRDVRWERRSSDERPKVAGVGVE